MTPNDPLPINPTLLPHTEQPERPHAEQGPPPADFATRPVPPVRSAERSPLLASEVTALVGKDEEAVEVNQALLEAEGEEPDTSES